MIGQYSSGSVVKDAGVKYGGSDIFVHLFYPTVTALLEYLEYVILQLVWFLLYNFIAVNLLLLKLSKGTAMMISLCTH